MNETERHPRNVFNEVQRVRRALIFVGRSYFLFALFVLDYIFIHNWPDFSSLGLFYIFLTALVLISFFWVNLPSLNTIILLGSWLGNIGILILSWLQPADQPNPFIPVTVLAFSGILLAVTSLPIWPAIGFSATLLISEYLIIKNAGEWIVGNGSSVNGYPVAVFYHSVATVAGVISCRKIMKIARLRDQASQQIEETRRNLISSRVSREERMRRLSQLHHSLLNLFIGLSGMSEIPNEVAVSTAKETLREIDDSQQLPKDLPSIFHRIIAKHQLENFNFRLIPGARVELSAKELEAIDAIMTELVNNAIRHSGGNSLRLGWKILDKSLVLFCEDDGIGILKIERPGFGWKEIIEPLTESIGGSTQLVKINPQGLRVEIEVNLDSLIEDSTSIEEALRARYANLNHGLTWANAFAAVGLSLMVPILAYKSKLQIELNILALFIGIYYSLILLRRELVNRSTIFIGFFLTLLLFLLAKSGFNASQDPAIFHWFGLIVGSGLLVALAESTALATVIAIPLFFVVLVMVGIDLPSYERKFVTIPLVTAGILGCLTLAVAWFYRRTEAKGEAFTASFADFRWKEEIARQISEKSQAKWNILLQNSRTLIQRIISEEKIDEKFARELALEEARIRAHLQIESLDQEILERVLFRLVENAYVIGRKVVLLVGNSNSILHIASEDDLTEATEKIRPYFQTYESDLEIDVYASHPEVIQITGKSTVIVDQVIKSTFFSYHLVGDGSVLTIKVDTSVKELIQ